MPDDLNEHVSQKSMTLDPTLEDSVHIDPFQEAREEAIEDAALRCVAELKHDRFALPVAVVKLAFKAGVEAAAALPRVHRIGVYDYDSLVECLNANFEQAFPGETMRDPQDAIQRLSATVMQLRRESANLEDAVRTLWTRNSELAPARKGSEPEIRRIFNEFMDDPESGSSIHMLYRLRDFYEGRGEYARPSSEPAPARNSVRTDAASTPKDA